MTTYERIIRLPALVVTQTVAEEIAGLMHDLAERRVTSALDERLRGMYRTAQPTQFTIVGGVQYPPRPDWLPEDEETYVAQNIGNEAYRNLLRPTYGDRYTFLSPHGNVQFLFDNFGYDAIPPDVETVIAEAGGPNGEILGLNAKANPQVADLSNPNFSRVLIQGPDQSWVNDVYARLSVIIGSRKEPIRHTLYHGMPLLVWLTFFAAVVLEYKASRLLAGFNWAQPVNGLQLLFVFVVLAVTLIASSYLFQRMLPYLFPYFEFENNLSQGRKTWRKPVVVAVTALYASAIGALLAIR